MPRPPAQPKFKVGDLVTEREKPPGQFLETNNTYEYRKRIKTELRKVGKVIAISTKKNRAGAKHFYFEVEWTNRHKSTHSQMRLKLYENN